MRRLWRPPPSLSGPALSGLRFAPPPALAHAPPLAAPASPTPEAESPPFISAEHGAAAWQRIAAGSLLGGLLMLAILAPALALLTVSLGLGALILGFLLLRATMVAVQLDPSPRSQETPALRVWPKITILAAMYDEQAIAPHFIHAMLRIDYPRDRLEVLVLLEEEDDSTLRALRACAPPPWIRLIVVPDGKPRTKPRALNHGLKLATGEIVGVFDAEDRPEPDQLRKAAAAFFMAPPDLACVQAQLAWYNARTNFLTRSLALEYASWFGVLMPGLARLGWPLPLGGTSCYLQTQKLRELGGWDAHNVTEDADLGFRIARRGWRSDALDSVTWEEAVTKPRKWVGQRTRWTKGFMTTWIVHMRDPARLWREIGPSGFFVLNALTLGTGLAYLTLPLHLAFLLWSLVMSEPIWGDQLSPRLSDWLSGLFWAGQATALAMAGFGGWRRFGPKALFWLPLQVFYLTTLGPYAAVRALRQLRLAPSLWEKTAHGVDFQGRETYGLGASAGGGAGAPGGRQVVSRGAV